MHILHICNDYSWTRVHKNLYAALDREGLRQSVFHPLRHPSFKGSNAIPFDVGGSGIVYSEQLKKVHRYFFGQKINFLYRDLERKVLLQDVDVVHATTLFSDGAVALRLKQRYDIPYVVAIRGTDINLFLKYMVYLHALGREILLNASQVIFISEAIRKNLLAHKALRTVRDAVLAKSLVLNNGIDDFWVDNPAGKKMDEKPTRIVYVGNYSPNKNVPRLIDAFLDLSKRYPGLKLNLVGEGGADEQKIRSKAAQHADAIRFLGPIFDKEQLREVYAQNDIFAMVSKSETFGLVYVEALSQGLPVLYTRGQGIDGFFTTQKVGEAAYATSVADIRKGLEELISNYHSYDRIHPMLGIFRWRTIAGKYRDLYREVAHSKTITHAQVVIQD